MFSLRWPESSNSHSPLGVEIRVCVCWLLFIWGTGEDMEGRWYLLKIWYWMNNTNCSSSVYDTSPFYSCRFSATNKSFAILTKFPIIKIACEWNKRSRHILITCTICPRATEKHLCVFHRKENTWKLQGNSGDFFKFPRQGFSDTEMTGCVSLFVIWLQV